MFRLPLALTVALSLIMLAPPMAHAQAAALDPAAKTVLDQFIAAQKALTGLSATIVVTGREIDGTPVKGKTIMLAFQQPNLAKVTISGPSGPLRQISTDGTTGTIFSVPGKQYTSEAVPSTFLLVFVVLGKAEEILPTLLALPEILTSWMSQPGTKASVGLSSTLNGVAVDTLDIALPLDPRAKIKITMTFGHDDHLLRQVIEAVTGTRGGKVVQSRIPRQSLASP